MTTLSDVLLEVDSTTGIVDDGSCVVCVLIVGVPVMVDLTPAVVLSLVRVNASCVERSVIVSVILLVDDLSPPVDKLLCVPICFSIVEDLIPSLVNVKVCWSVTVDGFLLVTVPVCLSVPMDEVSLVTISVCWPLSVVMGFLLVTASVCRSLSVDLCPPTLPVDVVPSVVISSSSIVVTVVVDPLPVVVITLVWPSAVLLWPVTSDIGEVSIMKVPVIVDAPLVVTAVLGIIVDADSSVEIPTVLLSVESDNVSVLCEIFELLLVAVNVWPLVESNSVALVFCDDDSVVDTVGSVVILISLDKDEVSDWIVAVWKSDIVLVKVLAVEDTVEVLSTVLDFSEVDIKFVVIPSVVGDTVVVGPIVLSVCVDASAALTGELTFVVRTVEGTTVLVVTNFVALAVGGAVILVGVTVLAVVGPPTVVVFVLVDLEVVAIATVLVVGIGVVLVMLDLVVEVSASGLVNSGADVLVTGDCVVVLIVVWSVVLAVGIAVLAVLFIVVLVVGIVVCVVLDIVLSFVVIVALVISVLVSVDVVLVLVVVVVGIVVIGIDVLVTVGTVVLLVIVGIVLVLVGIVVAFVESLVVMKTVGFVVVLVVLVVIGVVADTVVLVFRMIVVLVELVIDDISVVGVVDTVVVVVTGTVLILVEGIVVLVVTGFLVVLVEGIVVDPVVLVCGTVVVLVVMADVEVDVVDFVALDVWGVSLVLTDDVPSMVVLLLPMVLLVVEVVAVIVVVVEVIVVGDTNVELLPGDIVEEDIDLPVVVDDAIVVDDVVVLGGKTVLDVSALVITEDAGEEVGCLDDFAVDTEVVLDKVPDDVNVLVSVDMLDTDKIKIKHKSK